MSKDILNRTYLLIFYKDLSDKSTKYKDYTVAIKRVTKGFIKRNTVLFDLFTSNNCDELDSPLGFILKLEIRNVKYKHMKSLFRCYNLISYKKAKILINKLTKKEFLK